jgi:hypothetical protein
LASLQTVAGSGFGLALGLPDTETKERQMGSIKGRVEAFEEYIERRVAEDLEQE